MWQHLGISMISGITLIYGVGINDINRSITHAVGSRRVSCPIYKTWHHMLERCYSEKWLTKYPTYVGCSVCPEWLKFSAFEKWMLAQECTDKQLDKDFLAAENKVYSPDTCIFIDQGLNKFLTDRALLRGDYPLGVSAHKDGGFVVRCWNPFKQEREYLGLFEDANVGHLLWKARKHEHALAYAEQQTDPRVAEALRVRYL